MGDLNSLDPGNPLHNDYGKENGSSYNGIIGYILGLNKDNGKENGKL